MAKKKQKYYVVWQGFQPGIYNEWKDCQLQVVGFPDARYKSFDTRLAAEMAYNDHYDMHYGVTPKKQIQKNHISRDEIIYPSIAVDAACSGSPGIMEYQGVWTQDKAAIFHRGPFQYSTNNIGEFLALVHGLSWLQREGLSDVPIYSDSRTALSWLRNKKVKTTLDRRDINRDSFQMLDRAEKWAQTHSWTNPVLKWATASWGEIPADFGRK